MISRKFCCRTADEEETTLGVRGVRGEGGGGGSAGEGLFEKIQACVQIQQPKPAGGADALITMLYYLPPSPSSSPPPPPRPPSV